MSDYYSETLDTLPLFRRTDPVTSKIAGTAAKAFKGEHERKILEALAAGPGTKDEIAARCSLSEQQVARRMHGLARRGKVSDTGITRSTATGRMATVWRKATCQS